MIVTKYHQCKTIFAYSPTYDSDRVKEISTTKRGKTEIKKVVYCQKCYDKLEENETTK